MTKTEIRRTQSLAGVIRERLASIEARLDVGVRQEVILQELAAMGHEISITYLRDALFRARKRRSSMNTETAFVAPAYPHPATAQGIGPPSTQPTTTPAPAPTKLAPTTTTPAYQPAVIQQLDKNTQVRVNPVPTVDYEAVAKEQKRLDRMALLAARKIATDEEEEASKANSWRKHYTPDPLGN